MTVGEGGSDHSVSDQVGKKTRDGSFGACFDVREKDRELVVYSARPGGRMWEVQWVWSSSMSVYSSCVAAGWAEGRCTVHSEDEGALYSTTNYHIWSWVGLLSSLFVLYLMLCVM